MILFLRGRKMTELCATRMELNDAFVELPQLFARASTDFENNKQAANSGGLTFTLRAAQCPARVVSDAERPVRQLSI